MIVDRAASVLSDFVAGANEADKHAVGVNWERDAQITEVFDLRNVVEGDPSPDGKGTLQIKRGIERSEERRVGKECRSRWSPYH